MNGIFISYSRVDTAITGQLASHLRTIYGYNRVWVDENLRAGQPWWDEIVEQIALCDIFILLVSPESLQSKYCMMELAEARHRHKRIIPVMVRARTDVPADIKRLHMIKMTDGLSVEALTALQAAINRPEAHAEETQMARPAELTQPSALNLTLPHPVPVQAGAISMPFSHAAPTTPRQTNTRPSKPVGHLATIGGIVLIALGVLVGLLWSYKSEQAAPPAAQHNAPTAALAALSTTPPTAAQPPTGLTLIYNPSTLILVNVSPQVLDASGLTFTNGGVRFRGDDWRAGNPLGVLAPGDCVQLWTSEDSFQPVPDVCERRLRWRQKSLPNVFWRATPTTSFTVQQAGVPLATCAVDAMRCFLPID